jgi:hypothetical protein
LLDLFQIPICQLKYFCVPYEDTLHYAFLPKDVVRHLNSELYDRTKITSFDEILSHGYSRPIVVGNLLPILSTEATPSITTSLECCDYDNSVTENESTPLQSPIHSRQESLASPLPLSSSPSSSQLSDPAILHPNYKSKLQFYFDSYENYTLDSENPVWADFPLTMD